MITRTMVVDMESEKESNTVGGSSGVRLRLMWPLLTSLQFFCSLGIKIEELLISSLFSQFAERRTLTTSRSACS